MLRRKIKIIGIVVSFFILLALPFGVAHADYPPGTYSSGYYDSGVYACDSDNAASDCNGAISSTSSGSGSTTNPPDKSTSNDKETPVPNNSGSGTDTGGSTNPTNQEASVSSKKFSVGWVLSTIGFALLLILGIWFFIAAARRHRDRTPGPH